MRLPVGPCSPSFLGACPWQHRHASEGQIKKTDLLRKKEVRQAGFLREVIFNDAKEKRNE
jgi:hypothetical protein